jgi:hypothetical protein
MSALHALIILEMISQQSADKAVELNKVNPAMPLLISY